MPRKPIQRTYPIERVYDLVTSMRFRKWSEKHLDPHSAMEEGSKSKAEIISDLKEMMD